MYSANFRAYKNAVVHDLISKRKEQSGFDWLNSPTRARIKKEYWDIAKVNANANDRRIFCEWLKLDADEQDLAGAINRRAADDFRGLERFILHAESEAKEINVEMLAILIGYPHRPFDNARLGLYKDIPISDHRKIQPVSAETIATVNGEPKSDRSLPQEGTSPESRSQFKWWYTILAVMVAGLFIIFLMTRKDCMFWSHDRYATTPCRVPRSDTPLISIDEIKLRGFRKIRRTDTLSGYAREHYWYTRVGNHYEVFTSGGTHPLYPDKKLKPVTDFVINYCHNHPDKE